MSRPTDWEPLADTDPVPGDPDHIERLAEQHADVATELVRQTANLRGLIPADGWDAEAGRAFAASTEDLAATLERASRRYASASRALALYAPELRHAQSLADRALATVKEAYAAIKANRPHDWTVAPTLAEAARADRRRQSALDESAEALHHARQQLRVALEHRDTYSSRSARAVREAIDDDGLKDSRWDRFVFIAFLLGSGGRLAIPGGPRPDGTGYAEDQVMVAERVGRGSAWLLRWRDNDESLDALTGYEAQDHADHIAGVAEAAGIDPRLLMGVVLNESGMRQRLPAFKNFDTPLWALERMGVRDEASLGMTSIQRKIFDSTVERYPGQFSDVTWYDLVHNNELSIKVTAWHLRDLQNSLPPNMTEALGCSREELVAYGYNAGKDPLLRTANEGAGLMTEGADYIRKFRANWSTSDRFFCRSQQWKCGER